MKKYLFNPERTFFTSDTHFYHESIIKFCNRPFDSVEDMNEKLIENWNSVVGKKDSVFHLGDFCFGGANKWNEMIDRLNGKIYLILGNHDMQNYNKKSLEKFKQVETQMIINIQKQKIILNHYPFLCYPGSYNNDLQFFGHVHTCKNGSTGVDTPRLEHLLKTQYDVGVDNNDYKPVNFLQIKNIINN